MVVGGWDGSGYESFRKILTLVLRAGFEITVNYGDCCLGMVLLRFFGDVPANTAYSLPSIESIFFRAPP